MSSSNHLTIAALRARYLAGTDTPGRVMERLLDEADDADSHHVWITRLSRERVLAYVTALDSRAIDELPLYGIPFAIKDNIDLEAVPTTAGCPDFAHTPERSATVVQRLIDAGAIPLGKTNLDQFATGLVGARSPYGACRNSFNPDYISGGSSSGSAVAVARGLASFSLGTDTAGSGRVPAAFNNIVGLKPSNGRLSTSGVVPACRSLDCVSIFALTAEDAAAVMDVAAGFDAADPYSCRLGYRPLAGMRCGVPRRGQLQFFGDRDYARLFDDAVNRLESLGVEPVDIDFAPFIDAARLLYEGPWIAERYAAVGEFLEAHPGALHPITRQIIEAGKLPTAAAAFRGEYRLRELKRLSEAAWSEADFLLTPTAGTIYSLLEVDEEPFRLNTNLGFYTNFMNLFDLSGVAVPAGFRADGMPFGVTLVGPRAAEHALLEVAGRLHRSSVATLGALEPGVPAPPAAQAPPPPTAPSSLAMQAPPTAPSPPPTAPSSLAVQAPLIAPSPQPTAPSSLAVQAPLIAPSPQLIAPSPPAMPSSPGRQSPSLMDLRAGHVAVAVCGAHMEGLQLNHQLRERAGYFLGAARTAPRYRLFALPGGPPQRPGLIRVNEDGQVIELEIWALPTEQVGSFLAGIPAPLGLGKVELDTGALVTGFICEGYAAEGAADISSYGSWRAYIKAATV